MNKSFDAALLSSGANFTESEKEGTASGIQAHMDGFYASIEDVKECTFKEYLLRKDKEKVNGGKYTPVNHSEAFNKICQGLRKWGHMVVGSSHALARGGARYVSLISFLPRNPADLGLEGGSPRRYIPLAFVRNSYDKRLPFSLFMGAHLHRANVLWISKAEAGQRRHTSKFDEDCSLVVESMMNRADKILGELSDRFRAYQCHAIEGMEKIHDLIFRAYDKGVLTKTEMAKSKKKLLETEGGGERWNAFKAMQRILSPRRGKNIFRYRNKCQKYEQLIDETVGFSREVSLDLPNSRQRREQFQKSKDGV
jgi:hypothetical protein